MVLIDVRDIPILDVEYDVRGSSAYNLDVDFVLAPSGSQYCVVLSGLWPTRHVWSAAVLQAKNEVGENGLRTCIRLLIEQDDLLAWMECAAPSSYLVTRPWKAVKLK